MHHPLLYPTHLMPFSVCDVLHVVHSAFGETEDDSPSSHKDGDPSVCRIPQCQQQSVRVESPNLERYVESEHL